MNRKPFVKLFVTIPTPYSGDNPKKAVELARHRIKQFGLDGLEPSWGVDWRPANPTREQLAYLDSLGAEVSIWTGEKADYHGRLGFIQGLWTENTGGGTMVDLVILSDGSLLGITDEVVVHYEDEDQFWGCDKDGNLLDDETRVERPFIDLLTRPGRPEPETEPEPDFPVTYVHKVDYAEFMTFWKLDNQTPFEALVAEAKKHAPVIMLDNMDDVDHTTSFDKETGNWLITLTLTDKTPAGVYLRALAGNEPVFDEDMLTHLLTLSALREETFGDTLAWALKLADQYAGVKADKEGVVKLFSQFVTESRQHAQVIIYG